MKVTILYTILMLSSFICSNTNNGNSPVLTTNKMIDSLITDPFKLHYDAIVIDTHNDIMMQVMEKGADISQQLDFTQSDLIRMKKGGLDVQVFSIYVPEKYKHNYFNYAIKEIDKIEQIAADNPDMFILVYNYEQLQKEMNKDRIVGLLGGEGGSVLEGSIDNLIQLHRRGLRYLGLTWNNSNEIAVSARDETEKKRNGGLTEFGLNVVKKMDELGIMIDVSHLGETAFWDVINTSKKPVIASHSCVYNLNPHYRNLKDEQIKAIARSGGVVFVNFFSKFLNSSAYKINSYNIKYKNDLNELENNSNGDLIKYNQDRYDFIQSNAINTGTSIDVLIEHIDYIVKLVGADHVGLGSDFDGEIYTPNELYDVTCYPIITKKLFEKGYSENDIRKILGLNFMRVFKEVCK